MKIDYLTYPQARAGMVADIEGKIATSEKPPSNISSSGVSVDSEQKGNVVAVAVAVAPPTPKPSTSKLPTAVKAESSRRASKTLKVGPPTD